MAKKGELFLKTIKYLFSNMITFYLSYCLLSYLTNGLMMKNVKEEPNGSKTTWRLEENVPNDLLYRFASNEICCCCSTKKRERRDWGALEWRVGMSTLKPKARFFETIRDWG